MLFNSYIFILAFLPVSVLGSHLLKKCCLKKGKEDLAVTLCSVWLIVLSLIFYGYFHPTYLFVLIGSILINYAFFRLQISLPEGQKRKIAATIAVLLNIASIFVFKYYDFFTENVNAVFKTNLPYLKLLMPLGISFFTFQQISFQVDTYRGETKDYGFLEYALFVSYFPQLVAGPIVLHNEMIPQFRSTFRKEVDTDMAADGLLLFVFGLGKKVLLADVFGRAVDTAFSDVWKFGTVTAFCVMLAYTLQIYFDFSGYCDMAIGLGRMSGIEIPLNFNMPYKSTNITEFWARWHITLTRFFRTYLYFPLGGNKKGKARTYLNRMIVFLVSGLWHGANWTFVLWGGLHGAFLVLDRMFEKSFRKLPKWFSWLVTFGFVNVAWALFRSDNIHHFLSFMKRFFVWDGFKISSEVNDAMGGAVWLPVYLIVGMIIVLTVPKAYDLTAKKKYNIPYLLAAVAILTLSILSLSEVSTFLYFNF